MSERDPEKPEPERGSQNSSRSNEPSAPLQSNSLQIFFNKDFFYEDETVKGHILITINDTFYPKRLILSVLGELSSHSSASLKKQKTLPKKSTYNPQHFDERDYSRTITIHRNQSKVSHSPTLVRTLTVMSKRPISRFATQAGNKISPFEDNFAPSNREIFLHYNIPIFTFKTYKLPPGKYQFPFHFTLSQQMMASFNYNNKGFQLAITYTLAAELEEDREDDDDDDIFVNNLRAKRELKIVKPSFKHNGDPNSAPNVVTEVSEIMSLPTFLCFKCSKTNIILRLEKAYFKLGESIRYEIESVSRKMLQKRCSIRASLVEEVITFSNQRDVSRIPLSEKLKSDEPSDFIYTEKGTKIHGFIHLPENMLVTFQTPNLDIEHFLEIIFTYTVGCGTGVVTLRAPIIIKQAGKKPDPLESLSSLAEENGLDDDCMIMPLAKFKLEEKFNLLSKTATVLNDMNP